MKVPFTGMTRFQGSPTHATMRIEYLKRLEDGSGLAAPAYVDFYSGYNDLKQGKWRDDHDRTALAQLIISGFGENEPVPLRITETFYYDDHKPVEQEYERWAVASDLEGGEFDYTQPQQVKVFTGEGLPVTFAAAARFKTEGTAIFVQLQQAAGQLADTMIDIAQSADAALGLIGVAPGDAYGPEISSLPNRPDGTRVAWFQNEMLQQYLWKAGQPVAQGAPLISASIGVLRVPHLTSLRARSGLVDGQRLSLRSRDLNGPLESGGELVWNANSTLPDDDGIIFRPTAIAANQPGRWIRPVYDAIYAAWFGAIGDYDAIAKTGTDNAPHFRKTTAALGRFAKKISPEGTSGYLNGIPRLILPAGRCRVQSGNSLSLPITLNAVRGYNISGTGPNSCYIVLDYDPTGQDYDHLIVNGKVPDEKDGNGVVTRVGEKYGWFGYSEMRGFSIVSTQTLPTAQHKFFILYTQEGAPGKINFVDMGFDNIWKTTTVAYGSANANGDLFRFTRCRSSNRPNVRTGWELAIPDPRNSQAVSFEMTDYDIQGGGIFVYARSGGNINAKGGSVEMTENGRWWDIQGIGSSIGPGNNGFTASGVRIEVRKSGPGVTFDPAWPTIFNVNAPCALTFNDVAFGQITSYADDVNYGVVTNNGTVTFNGGYVPSQLKMKLLTTGANYSNSYKPHVQFNRARLGAHVARLVSFQITDNAYNSASQGTADADGCELYRGLPSAQPCPVDISLGWNKGFRDGSAKRRFWTWTAGPNPEGGGLPTPTAALPSPRVVPVEFTPGARILKFILQKFRQSASVNCTLAVKNLTGTVLFTHTWNTNDVPAGGELVAFSPELFEPISLTEFQNKFNVEVTGDVTTAGSVPGKLVVEYV